MQKSTSVRPLITGILLAAGQGSRFDPTGQKNKLFALLPTGRNVLMESYFALLPHVDEVVIVTSHAFDQVQALFSGLAVKVLSSQNSLLGMGASIACGVQNTQPELGWFVALGDMPYIKADTYQALRSEALVHQAIVRPRYQQQSGHPVFFPVSFGTELAALDSEQGARALVKRNSTQLRYIDVDDAGVCLDIDYPTDIKN